MPPVFFRTFAGHLCPFSTTKTSMELFKTLLTREHERPKARIADFLIELAENTFLVLTKRKAGSKDVIERQNDWVVIYISFYNTLLNLNCTYYILMLHDKDLLPLHTPLGCFFYLSPETKNKCIQKEKKHLLLHYIYLHVQ